MIHTTKGIAQVDLKEICFFLYILTVATFVWVSAFWLFQVGFCKRLYLARKAGVISPDCRHLPCAHYHPSQLFRTPFRVAGDEQIVLGYNSSDVVGLKEIVPVFLNWLIMH